MSTLKLENLQNPSAGSASITLATDGSLTLGTIANDINTTNNVFHVDASAQKVHIGNTSDVDTGALSVMKNSGSNFIAHFRNTGVNPYGVKISAPSGDNPGYPLLVVMDHSSTEYLKVQNNGYVTTPGVPAFCCYNLGFSGASSGWSTATTGSGNAVPRSDAMHFNNGNHYSGATGYFTAPISGYYQFNLSLYGKKDNNHGDNSGYYWAYFEKNAANYYGTYIMEGYYNSGDYDQGSSISTIMYLVGNDTCRPLVGAYTHGVSIYGPNCQFSGHMIG
tara:strand:+ start:1158 stop:1988 length:831 start_codon:yes stop_codon:yes gene_type:complete